MHGDRFRVPTSNLSVGKYMVSVKVFEAFKLMLISPLLPRWEVMIYNLQAEHCASCLCTLALRRLKQKGFEVRSCLKNRTR